MAKKCRKTPAAPQAFTSPNPPRHSRKSVAGVIQLRVPLAGCAGFFLQSAIPRRILTKMFEAMNMRFAKRSWGIRASKSAFCYSVVRVVGLANSANFHSAERVLSLYRTTTQRGAGFSRQTRRGSAQRFKKPSGFSRENRSRAARKSPMGRSLGRIRFRRVFLSASKMNPSNLSK